MGATKYWSRKKKSKAEKDDQRKKSSTGNVKRNSSGTSSSPNHLRASDGSCLDVCRCKKGHFSPVKAWNPTPEKDIRSPFGKLKISTAQLKPSLNVRTNSSPAVNNIFSAVKLKASPEPPGITKTEIPLLSKKFQVINRHPSDSRIFKYNESVISSPNSSPGSTGKLVAGSPFSSPTSLIGLNGTRKTAIQSRDITGTSKTSMESTASLSMEPFQSRVVSPFGRKFSSRGLFSAAQNQKKGKAESKKSFNEKDQVLVKFLDITDPPIESKILEREQNLCVEDAVAEKKMLDSIQTDVQRQISPSISLMSRPTMKFTDGEKILHVNDEKNMLDHVQTNGDSQISPSTIPLSELVKEFTHERDEPQNLRMADAETKNEVLEPMNGKIQISPSTSPLSCPEVVKLTHDSDQAEIFYLDELASKNGLVEAAVQIDGHSRQISASTSPLLQDRAKILHMVDDASKNETLEPVQTDGHIQISPSPTTSSKSDMKLTHHDKDRTKDLHVDDEETKNEVLEAMQTDMTFIDDTDQVKISHMSDAKVENEMLESMQTNDQRKIPSSASLLFRSSLTLTRDNDREKILHVNDATTTNEMLETVQNDGHGHISSSTSPLSQYEVPPAQYNDKVKHLHMNDAASENDMLEPLQTDDLGKVFPSASPLSRSAVTLTHDNDQAKIFHVNGATTVNKRLQNDCHSQISPSTFQLSQSALKITHHHKDQTKNLPVKDSATENKMLEPVQTDGHMQVSSSTSPLSNSTMKLTLDKGHEKNLLVDDAMTKDKMLKDMRIEGHSQISQSASPVSQPDGKLTNDNEQVNLLYTVDVASKNEMLEQVQTDGHNHISPSTSHLLKHGVTFAHDNDMMNILHVNDTTTKNEMLEPIQTQGRKFSSSTSPLSWSSVTLNHDNNQTEIFHVVDATTWNEMLESDGHIQISTSISPLSMSTVKLTHDDDQGKILHVVERSENEMTLELVQTDDHIQNSHSTSSFFQSQVLSDAHSEPLPCHADELAEPEYTDAEELYEDIDVEALENFEYIDASYDSEDSEFAEETDEIKLENVDVVNINKVDTAIGMQHKNPDKGKQYACEDKDLCKCKFRRGSIVDLQSENDVPRKLKFRRRRVPTENGTKTYVERIRLKKRETVDNTKTTSPGSDGSEYAQSETVEFNPENGEATSIDKVDMLQGKHHRNPRKGKQFIMEEDSPAYKCKFRRGRIVKLQMDNDVPRWLEFRRGRIIENEDGSKTYVRRRRFKKREIVNNVNATSPDSEKVVLRHQEMQEKKDELCLFNHVIEETVTILSKSRKSKVKALVGAFETVISLQDDTTPPGDLSRSPLLTPQ